MPDTLSSTLVEELVNNVTTGRSHTLGSPFTSPDPTAFSNPPVGAQYKVTSVTATGQTITGISAPLQQSSHGSVNWVRQLKQVGGVSLKNVLALCVKVHTDGSVIVCGTFKNTADFGTPGIAGSVTSTPLVAVGAPDLFIVKYDSNGAHQWSRRYGTSGGQMGGGTFPAMALDASGNIFIAGSFNVAANLGGSTFTALASGGSAFIAKYNSSGAHQWSYMFGTVAGLCAFQSIAVNSLGVIAGGGFACSGTNPINFGTPGHPGTDLYGTSIQVYACIVGFSANGDYQWSNIFTPTGESKITGIVTDASDNIYLAAKAKGMGGFFVGNVIVNGISQQDNIFLARLGPSGQLPPYAGTWGRCYGGAGQGVTQSTNGIALDSAGSLVCAGWFFSAQGTFANFGGGPVASAANEADGWVAKYSSVDGSFQRSAVILGMAYTNAQGIPAHSNDCIVNGVAVDASNNVYLTGLFDSPYNFGTGFEMVRNHVRRDIFAVKYNPNLQVQWVSNFGDDPNIDGLTLDCEGQAIAITMAQKPVVAGCFGYTVVFPPSITAATSGSRDGCLINLNP